MLVLRSSPPPGCHCDHSSPVMFLSCCCPSGRKESKKRKASSGGQSSCPSSPQYRPHYQPHSPIFTIQSQPANIQSDSLSSEDFYYYQVAPWLLCESNSNPSPCQDVYLQSRDTLLPNKSKLHTVGFNPGASDLTFIDTASQLDTETIPEKPSTAKTLPRSGTRGGRLPCKIFASPENFKLSVRSLSQSLSSRSGVSSSPEFMRK